MDKRVLVSVIIPTYNRAGFLRECLQSVFLSLTSIDFEIIVVDDGSLDNTRDFVDSFNSSKIKYIYQCNRGVSAARNRGITKSKGEWICFLDSDDLWSKGKIEKQIERIEKTKTLWGHTGEIWIRNGIRINQQKKHQKKEGRIYIDSLPLCVVSPSSVIIHKSIFKNLGVFDESFMVAEDYDMWLRISSIYDISLVPEELVIKRGGHNDQLSKLLAIDMYRVRALRKCMEFISISSYERDLTLYYLFHKINILINGFNKHKKYQVASYYKELLEHVKDKYFKKIFPITKNRGRV